MGNSRQLVVRSIPRDGLRSQIPTFFEGCPDNPRPGAWNVVTDTAYADLGVAVESAIENCVEESLADTSGYERSQQKNPSITLSDVARYVFAPHS